MRTKREARGRYLIIVDERKEVWTVWKSYLRGLWVGESTNVPGWMVEAPTLATAKYDIKMQYYVKCSSAGIG